jgi:hypothetical protein
LFQDEDQWQAIGKATVNVGSILKFVHCLNPTNFWAGKIKYKHIYILEFTNGYLSVISALSKCGILFAADKQQRKRRK